MTFLEFFEALIGCAEIFATDAVVKDPTTPRPSTVLTQDPSVYSMPASPSRMTSQVCTPHPSTVLAQDPSVYFMPASLSRMACQVRTPPNHATSLSSLRLPHCHCWKSWQRTPSQPWQSNWGETHVQAEFWFTAEGYSTSYSDAHCFMLEEDWEKIGWMNWEARTQTGRIPDGRQSVSDLVLAVS